MSENNSPETVETNSDRSRQDITEQVNSSENHTPSPLPCRVIVSFLP